MQQHQLAKNGWKQKWHGALTAALTLLVGANAHAQSADVKINEFSLLKRQNPQRAMSIVKQIQATPKAAKRILTENRIEWCGAMDEFRRQRGLSANSTTDCFYGPPDDPIFRNTLIPTASTPFKTIRVKINIFANDDGSSPVATLADADAQMAQLNKDYAPAHIRFVNNGVRFVPSTRFRNMASYSEVDAMKTIYNNDPAHNLNFYVFDAEAFNPLLLGTGYFPWNANPTGAPGGFFCDNNAFGAGQRTATHEIGHVLGLWHPHYGVSDIAEPGQRCSLPCAEFAGRTAAEGDITGDLCSDTPPTPRNFQCGPPEDNPDTKDVNEAIDPCNNTPWGTTDYSNYMGYTSDDCINHFTSQQMGRMHGWINEKLSAWQVGADSADPPTVVLPSTTDMATVTTNAVSVTFSKAMNPASTQAAFRFAPALSGTYVWSNGNKTVTFTASSLPAGTAYTVKILGTASSASNAPLTLDGNFNEKSEGSPLDDYAFMFRSQGAPRNNMFAAAQVITGNSDSVPGFNVGANKEANEPNHGAGIGGASVWYKWTAPNTGNVTFDTRGASFDTALAIYIGGSVATLSPVASNEDETSTLYTSRVTFRAIAGTAYYIAVDGYNSSSTTPALAKTGTIVLRWNNILAPANDNWAQAQLISGAAGSTTGTNFGAYSEANEPDYSSNTSGVWYKWVAPSSGAVYFDTEGSDFDTNLAAYSGTSIGTLGQVAYDYDSGTGSLSQAPFTTIAGTTYYIAVSGGYGFDGARGAIKLNWRSIVAPANDPFATPKTITGVQSSVSGSNVGASNENNEPYGDSSPHASLWYKWVAPDSGLMTIDTLGSGNDESGTPFDTTLSVYTGSTLSALNSITHNDDAPGVVTSLAQWTAVKGTTYFISVDGAQYDWRLARGSFKLNWNLIAAPANDLFAKAQVISGQSGKVSGTNLGANHETNEPYGASNPNVSVWFKWTAPSDGMITFDTLGSGNNQAGTPFDTMLSVFQGSALSNLELITSNNDVADGQITSRVRWTAVGGVTYYISLDGASYYSNEVMGDYALNWHFVAAPANDLFANRMMLTGSAGRVSGTNIGANHKEDEPYGVISPTASVWFSWTAPISANVKLNTIGSGKNLEGTAFDTAINVYEGADLLNLNWVAGNDDGTGVTSSLIFAAKAGTTYQLSVDGSAYYYDQTMGSYVLNWAQGSAVSQAPTITSFTPAKGAPGTVVTITGTKFVVGGTTVKFGGIAATSATANSTTKVTATVPAGAKTGPITVTTNGGTAQSATDFIVTPSITNFTPTQGIVGTLVTINGSNFSGATSVQFNATSATEFTVVSPMQIIAKVPIGALTGRIKVTTAGGIAQSAGNFTVGPWIVSFSPSAAPVGASVVVRGGNFAGVTAVKIGALSLPADSFTVNSVAQITIKVPAAATDGPISITNAVGTANSATNLLILPGITSFTPTIGKTSSTVTLTGTNFTGITGVQFNGVAAAFTVVSDTTISTRVPIGAANGKISVTNVAGTGLSSGVFKVDDTTPVGAIAAPLTNKAVVTAFPTTITGTVNDNSGVINVKSVQLSIARALNGATQYWNPTTATWDATIVKFDTAPARPNAGTAWSFSGALPSGANLPDGAYVVSLFVIDVPGNAKSYANTVTVKATNGIASQTTNVVVASPVTLSSAEIITSTSRISLKFSRPLQSDPGQFVVTINGAEVALASAIFAASEEIELQLPENALCGKDAVVVAWKNLKDAQGRPIDSATCEIVVP